MILHYYDPAIRAGWLDSDGRDGYIFQAGHTVARQPKSHKPPTRFTINPPSVRCETGGRPELWVRDGHSAMDKPVSLSVEK